MISGWRGHFLYWPKWMCAAELGLISFVSLRHATKPSTCTIASPLPAFINHHKVQHLNVKSLTHDQSVRIVYSHRFKVV